MSGEQGIDLNCVVKLQVAAAIWDPLKPYRPPGVKIQNGTGFFISENRLLTNYHVIHNAIEIIYCNDEGRFPAHIVGTCADRDLAILETEHNVDSGLEFTDSLSVKLGDEVYALGFPSGEQTLKITKGIISGFTSIMGPTFIQTTADLNHGNSGGPLICNGKVIGIVTGGREEMSGVGYAIPSRSFLMIQHIMYGNICPPNLELVFRGDHVVHISSESELTSVLKIGDKVKSIACSDFVFSGGILKTKYGRRRTSYSEISEILPLCEPLNIILERNRENLKITVTLNCNVERYEEEKQDYVVIAGMVIANVTERMTSGNIGDIIVTYVFLETPQIFEPGDIITNVNDVDITTVDDIRKAVDLKPILTINGFEIGKAEDVARATTKIQKLYGITTSHLSPDKPRKHR